MAAVAVAAAVILTLGRFYTNNSKLIYKTYL